MPDSTGVTADWADRWRQLTTGPVNFPPSNRGESSLLKGKGQVDTIGFCFEIGPDVDVVGCTATVVQVGTPEEVVRYNRRLEGGGFLGTGLAGKAWVEASLPKRRDGSNVDAVGVPEGLELMREMYGQALEFCQARGKGKRFELSQLVRVDAVRDFDGVHHAGELLAGLSRTPRPAVQKVKLYQDAERNRAETLTVGPKAWHMTAYDKHAETGGQADEGRLRTETRLHKKQLLSERAKKEGWAMGHVADMTSEVVDNCHRGTFALACFDREVVGNASVAAAVFASGLSPRRQRELWCFLTMPGVQATMGKNQVTEYRRLARSLGVTPAAAEDEMPEIRVRLDYETGREVCRVA